MNLDEFQKLPTKLGKEPLVDVVFEIRFKSNLSASSVLPGLFFKDFASQKFDVKRLPLHDIPAEVRAQESGMQYKPLVRMVGRSVNILIGDNVAVVASKIPYIGWSSFKDEIKKAIDVLINSEIVDGFERFSFKYVDLLPGQEISEQVSMLDLDLRAGPYAVQNETFTLKLQVTEDNIVHILTIAAPATAKIGGLEKKGVILDIDSICNIDNTKVDDFLEYIEPFLDDVHYKNKEMFFKCITEETLNILEPTYD